jgi:microcystin-dependent protein
MPADSTSALLEIKLQGTGNNENTWGDLLNEQALQLLENAIAADEAIDLAGGNVTLTSAQNRKAILEFTGTITGNTIVTVKNLSHRWIMRNACSGAFSVTIKTASGSAVALPVGWSEVWCDGANVVYVGPSTYNFATQMQVGDGTVSLPGYSFTSDTNTGIRRKGADNGTLVANGSDVLEWLSTGVNVTGALAVSGAITQGGSRIVPVGTMSPTARITAPTGWLLCYGQAISRTTYSELFDAITVTATATRNGTTSLSSVSLDLTGLGLEGAKIEGTGIATGTTIASLTSNSITLSQAASGSGSITIRILPHGQGDASTTFNVPDRRDVVSSGRGNMGGTSRNLLTGQSGGIDGDRLGNTGGSETHTLTAAQSAVLTYTSIVTDPGHAHPLDSGNYQAGTTSAFTGNPGAVGNATDSALTGITVATTSNAGGGAHNNVQPTVVDNWMIFAGV